jgi:hypothetical protein
MFKIKINVASAFSNTFRIKIEVVPIFLKMFSIRIEVVSVFAKMRRIKIEAVSIFPKMFRIKNRSGLYFCKYDWNESIINWSRLPQASVPAQNLHPYSVGNKALHEIGCGRKI